MTIKAIVHEEGDGFWAEVPGMPGCVTEGDTMEELVSNLREAIEGWIEADQELKMSVRAEDKGSRELELHYTASAAA